jgi:hypothetical protein
MIMSQRAFGKPLAAEDSYIGGILRVALFTFNFLVSALYFTK